MCLRDIIPIMNLIQKISKYVKVYAMKLKIKYKLFENNKSYIKIAKAPILTPRTKYITLEYHRFYLHINKGLILIESIYTREQNADLLTKPVGESQLTYL